MNDFTSQTSECVADGLMEWPGPWKWSLDIFTEVEWPRQFILVLRRCYRNNCEGITALPSGSIW